MRVPDLDWPADLFSDNIVPDLSMFRVLPATEDALASAGGMPSLAAPVPDIRFDRDERREIEEPVRDGFFLPPGEGLSTMLIW